jgi:hypothetical protein
MMCIILFYMYHQIEDLRSEIHHLHNKTDNLSELEKYIDKSKKIEVIQNLDNALKSILPNNNQNNEINETELKKPNNEIILDNESTSSEFIESEQSNKFEVNVNDVMNLVETNRLQMLNSNLNNQFKIKELSASQNSENSANSQSYELNKSNNSISISSYNEDDDDEVDEAYQADEADEADEAVDLEIEAGIENNIENEISLNQLDDLVNSNEKSEASEDTSGVSEVSEINTNMSLSKLMRLKLEKLQEIAKEKSIELEKESDGKRKKRNKKELCTEILNSNSA